MLNYTVLFLQIANFHNTIGDQMIPSQRAMMLEAALALSGIVQEHTKLNWSNTNELDSYIDRLKKATQRLARENKQLALCHLMIKDRVCWTVKKYIYTVGSRFMHVPIMRFTVCESDRNYENC